jgi:hypothetical protein
MAKLELGSTHTCADGTTSLVVAVSSDGKTGLAFSSKGSRVKVDAPAASKPKISRKKSKE